MGFYGGDEVDTAEGGGEVGCGWGEGACAALGVEGLDVGGHAREEGFGDVHQVFEVGVGVVEFAGGELGVVGFIDACREI